MSLTIKPAKGVKSCRLKEEVHQAIYDYEKKAPTAHY